jgi:hypothetical protein
LQLEKAAPPHPFARNRSLPAGSCPGTTLGPIAPLGEPPGAARSTIHQLFGSMHAVGYLGFCAVGWRVAGLTGRLTLDAR